VAYGYDFTCARCGKRHRSQWNIIAEALGFIPKIHYLPQEVTTE
jgi:hypothetical protein